MQKNRTEAVPFKLPSTDVSSEALSNLEKTPVKNKDMEGKKRNRARLLSLTMS